MASVDNVYDIAPINKYVASSGQTVFDYDFPIFDAVDLRVYVGDVLQSIGTDYTVQGEGNENGGTVTFLVGRVAGTQVTIYRKMPIERLTDMAQNGPMRAADFNQELDRITMYLQEIERDMARSLRFGLLGNSPSPELSPIDNWKDRYLYVNSSGALQPSVNIGTTPLSQSVIGELLYPVSSEETSAGIIPANQAFPVGNVLRYGADPTGTVDSTFAIQSAIDVGQAVIFPTGNYLAAGLVSSTAMQQFIAVGDVWIYKNADGPIWTSGGRDCLFERLKFNGRSDSYIGHNLVITGDNCTLLNCGSRDAEGRAVLSTTGNGLRIIGTVDIYQTADQSIDGYDIEIRGGGNYSRVIAVTSSQHAGGLLIDNAGAVALVGSQLGKLTIRNIGGVMCVGNRLNTINVASSNCTFTANSIAGDVILGPGGVPISGVTWSSDNIVSSGQSFTLGAGVRESAVNLETMQSGSVVLSIDRDAVPLNYITSGPISYEPEFSSAGGGASLGNGQFLYAAYTHKGKRVSVDVSLLVGSTTSFGSGILRIGLPFPAHSSSNCVGSGIALEAGVSYFSAISETAGGASYATFYTHGNGAQVNAANPFSWGDNDRLKFSIEYDI